MRRKERRPDAPPAAERKTKDNNRQRSTARPKTYGLSGRSAARALELGADELAARLGWELRARPRALANLRARYRDFCFGLFAALERAR